MVAGCQSGEESAGNGNETVVTTNANQVSFDIPGMTWNGCATSVREALAGVDGVKGVSTDVNARTAVCTIDPDGFDQAAAVAALKKSQFPGTPK